MKKILIENFYKSFEILRFNTFLNEKYIKYHLPPNLLRLNKKSKINFKKKILNYYIKKIHLQKLKGIHIKKLSFTISVVNFYLLRLPLV